AVDRIEVDRLELDRSELREIAADANADALLQEFASDRAGRDAHRGLARRCPPAAAIVSESVFLVVRVIRVARAIAILDLLVIARALNLVLDQEADRRAGRPALEHAGQDPHAIRLAALRDETRLPRPAPVEILLDILLRQPPAGRTAVDDAAERRPVALAEGRDRECLAERVARHLVSVLEPVSAVSASPNARDTRRAARP